jgi:hypothetical protein
MMEKCNPVAAPRRRGARETRKNANVVVNRSRDTGRVIDEAKELRWLIPSL